jgi:hypothetical protein
MEDNLDGLYIGGHDDELADTSVESLNRGRRRGGGGVVRISVQAIDPSALLSWRMDSPW